MKLSMQHSPAIHFDGKVTARNGFETITDNADDKYVQANITYGIRSFTDPESLQIKKAEHGLKTILTGLMSNKIINLIADKWDKNKNIYDADRSDQGKQVYQIPESPKNRKFEASVSGDEIVFCYNYPDGEKFEWTFKPEDVRNEGGQKGDSAPVYDTAHDYLIELFAEVTKKN